jgi:hypothetical protein
VDDVSTRTVPWSSWATWATMARPRPEPDMARAEGLRQNRSKT